MKNSLDYRRELRSYLAGFVAALVLTCAPFAMVAWGQLRLGDALTLIGLCAFLQVIVHFRFFFHIDMSRQKREDLHLILFATLLLAIMVSGTIWIMGNLATRMH